MSELKLIEAVKAGNAESIKQLIESGEDVNQQDEQGWTPLNWASGRGDLATVKLLVESGADLFKVGRDQRTPYMIALAAGRVEVVKFLREAEEKNRGDRPGYPERIYCKAYYLRDLRRFPGWSESRINWKSKENNVGDAKGEGEQFSDESIVFLHQDFTVTQSMWHNENVLFNNVTPEWEQFCASELGFRVPDDIDLIVSVESSSSAQAT
jgi:hypothetical protein